MKCLKSLSHSFPWFKNTISGAVVFSMFFREMDYESAFFYMGIAVLCSSAVTVFIHIRGESNMLCRRVHSFEKGSLLEEEYEEEVEELKLAGQNI